MINGELRWETVVLEDPLGGRIVLWPHLPCVRMPSSLRYRGRWNGLALLFSLSDLSEWRQDATQDKESPGVHIDAAIASGTVLGRLMKDLKEYDVDGPKIPDPEQLRLLHTPTMPEEVCLFTQSSLIWTTPNGSNGWRVAQIRS